MRLLVIGAVVLGLVLSGDGLTKIVYFERTHEAVAEARVGNLLRAFGCALPILCAVVVFSTGPGWAAAAIAAPAVICGGLALVADESGGGRLPRRLAGVHQGARSPSTTRQIRERLLPAYVQALRLFDPRYHVVQEP